MARPSRYSYYVKALKFYKQAKKQFVLNDEGKHTSRKYFGLCLFLEDKSPELTLTPTQQMNIQDNIWSAVKETTRNGLFFPTPKIRVKYINKMIKNFSAKVDKYK